MGRSERQGSARAAHDRAAGRRQAHGHHVGEGVVAGHLHGQLRMAARMADIARYRGLSEGTSFPDAEVMTIGAA